ncbi:MAG: DUF362 domain-containing protein [Thermoflexales bacterium]|nr:DUF362 domain-containing protein [Thermoflexales bacterium]
MNDVAIVRSSYHTAEEQIREALRLLDWRPQHDKILLKPNLVTVPRWLPIGGSPGAIITNLRFIEALLRVFEGHKITIAEGALAGCDTGAILEQTGVVALARKYGAQVASLDRAERFELPWAFGTLRLPILLQTHEYINVPKLKTHLQTGVSLGCKNQKGLLSSAAKMSFHRKLDLHAAIWALADAVQPALTIVDGIVGLDGPGPTMGRERYPGLIVAGRDMRAVDVACCDLISIPLERVPHLERVPYRTLGCAVEDVRLRFDLPADPRVANVHIHAAPNACSRCMQSMNDGQVALWRSPYHVLRGTWNCILKRTDLIMGEMEDIPPAARGRLVCYGDCTCKLAEKHGLRFIPGCPPSVGEHMKMY